MTGKYNAGRIFQTVLNLLLLVFMVLQPLCGVLMSKQRTIALLNEIAKRETEKQYKA